MVKRLGILWRSARARVSVSLKNTWPDLLNLTIGLWMILSAFFTSLAGPPPGKIVALMSGAAVSVISLAAMIKFGRRKEAINLLLGLWLIAAPFVLGFADQWNPLINYVLDGLILAGHATFQMVDPPKQRRGAL